MEKTKNVIITILSVTTVLFGALSLALITGKISFDKKTDEKIEEKKEKDNEDIYHDILVEYKNALNDKDINNSVEAIQEEYPLVNANMVYLLHNYDNEASYKYLFLDINNDDTDELIVIQGIDNIIDVFSYNGEDAFKVIDDIDLGYDTNLTITIDGTMLLTKTNSNKNIKYTLIKLEDNKTNIIDTYYKNDKEDTLYKYVEVKQKVDDKEFNKIINTKSIDIESVKKNNI